MDWTDIVRLINVTLAATALVWLVVDLKGRAKFLTPRRLYLTYSLAAFLFAVVFGSTEQILRNVEPGWRMVVTTTAVVWTLIGLYLGRNDDNPIDVTLAEAWDQGRRTGSSRAMRHMSDEPSLPLASSEDNPYLVYEPPVAP